MGGAVLSNESVASQVLFRKRDLNAIELYYVSYGQKWR